MWNNTKIKPADRQRVLVMSVYDDGSVLADVAIYYSEEGVYLDPITAVDISDVIAWMDIPEYKEGI